MIFDQLFQWFGYHGPALGAFLICLLFVSCLCYAFFAWGRREANKRWTWQVEHMPQIIAQEIRERLERRLIEQAVKIKWLQERHDHMEPAFKSLAVIAENLLTEKKQ